MKLKTILGGTIALAFVLPLAASAATISDPLFSNGDQTIDAAGNSTVNGTFTLQVSSGEVCEVVRTQAAPQAFTDTQVGGTLGHQFGTYTNVPFSVKVSPNTGTYTATVQCAGIFGGNHSVDGADGVVASANLGTIRVTANGSSYSSSSATPSAIDALSAQIAALASAVSAIMTAQHPANPVIPTVSADCAALAPFAHLYQGSSDPSVGQLQGFLLYKGMSIPLLQSNQAKYGYFGPQTAGALVQFKMAKNCS